MTIITTRPAPIAAADIAAVRKPYRAASLLPRPAYQDPAVFDWERDHIFRRDWLCVGRESELPEAGSYRVAEIHGEDVVLVGASVLVLAGQLGVS